MGCYGSRQRRKTLPRVSFRSGCLTSLYSLQGILGRGATHRTCSSLPKTCLTFVYSLSRLSGKQVIVGHRSWDLNTSPIPRQRVSEKLCRMMEVYDNL